jgi:hypothetical protein
MRVLFYAVPLLISLGGSAAPPAAQACNVTVDVIDPDSRSTNVRDRPGGKIIATLTTSQDNDDWIEVHVVAQYGDWFLVDRADLVGDDRKAIYRGRGYMHRSVLGADSLVWGEPVRVDHDARSALVTNGKNADEPAYLLGCRDTFMKVRIKEGAGWTKNLCLNQRTTCG